MSGQPRPAECGRKLPRTLLAAAATALLVAGCGPASGRPAAAEARRAQAALAPPAASPTPPAAATRRPVPAASAPAAAARPRPPAGPQIGARGPAVLALQRRLAALGYWLGAPDGAFGDSTQQAVFAVQKSAGLPPDGVVGPLTAAALRRGVLPRPRSSTGRVVEVDLERDLLLVVSAGRLEAVLNTSTGGGYTYLYEGRSWLAETPRGRFHVLRAVDGTVVDALGSLWRPRYFDGPFAIHGDSAVPPVPVSHGCVRVSDEAIDWLWSADLLPLGGTVWVY